MPGCVRKRVLTFALGPMAAIALVGCADPAAAPSSGTTVTPPHPENSAPAVVFSTNCTLLDCTFDAAASSDSDGTITNYGWAFGDGVSSAGVNASHSYGDDGSYTIMLTVTDDDGASSDGSQAVDVVSAGNSNNPPTASFSSNCADLICNFDASGSFDSDGAVVSYAWDYGDSTSGSGQTSGNIYATGGSYTVVLVVADNGGATSSSSQELSVNGSGGPPDGQALFTQKCSTCHGTDALGGTLAKISIVGKTAQEITDAIMSVPNMSSMGNLTAEEIQAIADYLATI
jgi:PKD repeat protein